MEKSHYLYVEEVETQEQQALKIHSYTPCHKSIHDTLYFLLDFALSTPARTLAISPYRPLSLVVS